jgi:hypothetical protein
MTLPQLLQTYSTTVTGWYQLSTPDKFPSNAVPAAACATAKHTVLKFRECENAEKVPYDTLRDRQFSVFQEQAPTIARCGRCEYCRMMS